MTERCHAGAGHHAAADRGLRGWLCNACNASVQAILDRLMRRAP